MEPIKLIRPWALSLTDLGGDGQRGDTEAPPEGEVEEVLSTDESLLKAH